MTSYLDRLACHNLRAISFLIKTEAYLLTPKAEVIHTSRYQRAVNSERRSIYGDFEISHK
jgi:hypothetical protein